MKNLFKRDATHLFKNSNRKDTKMLILLVFLPLVILIASGIWSALVEALFEAS